jgi:hypothetical protein
MTKRGGMLFILEGDKPPEESASGEELRGVMQEFRTLESPFDPRYLRSLLDEFGFAIVGDYVSVNGLFPRDSIEQNDRLPIRIEPINYLLCKKVSEDSPASMVPTSREPNILAARIKLVPYEGVETTVASIASKNFAVVSGEVFQIPLEIENTGDTIWLTSQNARRGAVMVGLKVVDTAGELISEEHMVPPVPGAAFAPGERTRITLKQAAPKPPGIYRLKIDLVCEEICWFEEKRETKPLIINFEVVGG